MPNRFKAPPRWLLEDIGLTDGHFENRTVIVGRPDAHNRAVLNTGSGPPATVRIDLTLRNNWDQIAKRLTNEGF